MGYREKYKEELQTAYDKPLDAAEFESVAAWIDRVAAGEYADADVMSLVAVRESLRAEVARLTAALDDIEENVLHKIDDWANAYPDDVFIEPTLDQWRAADKLLKEHGMSMTAITGSAARHCVTGIQKYAKRGLEIAAALSPSTNESEEQNE